MDKIFENILAKESDDKSFSACDFGVYCCGFLKHDPIVTELFHLIEGCLNDSAFKKKFISIYKGQLSKEKEIILQKINEAKLNCTSSIDRIEKKLQINTIEKYIEEEENELWLDILNNTYKIINNKDGCSYILENYYLYCIGRVLFEDYKSEMSRKKRIRQGLPNEILAIYIENDIEILKIDSQCSKYGLLSLTDDFEIYNDKDCSAIKDKRIGKYFLVCVPITVFSAIQNLKKNELIKKVSFKIDSISAVPPLMEETEFGEAFGFEALCLPELSKFYDQEKYEDNLWIKVDKIKKSMTFEEILQDFEEFEDKVVTQVVHLEFFLKNDSYFISHIDHEYILYSLDTFTEKLNNHDVKGEIKVKTFKIDNSCIPFNYKINDNYFLYLVIDSYFSKKELLKEYFSKIS